MFYLPLTNRTFLKIRINTDFKTLAKMKVKEFGLTWQELNSKPEFADDMLVGKPIEETKQCIVWIEPHCLSQILSTKGRLHYMSAPKKYH